TDTSPPRAGRQACTPQPRAAPSVRVWKTLPTSIERVFDHTGGARQLRGAIPRNRSAYARVQRGSITSSICVNTTCTGSPIAIVDGSISLMSPSGAVTRLPAKRIVGSSSSSTMMALYGAFSAYAGNNGGCGTMNDQMRPRPDVRAQVTSVDWQYGHIG